MPHIVCTDLLLLLYLCSMYLGCGIISFCQQFGEFFLRDVILVMWVLVLVCTA